MKQPSIKKNIIMNSVLTMSSFIFPLITFPYVSRVLGPAGNGKVSWASSIIMYFTMFAQLGIPTYGIRACAKSRDNQEELNKITKELVLLNIITAIISYVALLIAVLFIPKIREEKYLFVVLSCNVFLSAIGIEWFYKALEQYTYITIRSILFKLIAIIAMFALVHSEEDYVIYGGISIFASSASYVFNFINSRKFINWRQRSVLNIHRHVKPAMIFFAMTIAAMIYTYLDTVMLGFMTTDAEVGFYNAAIKIKNILVSIVTSFGAVLLPRASYYIEKNQTDEFETIIKKALNYVIIISIPLAMYFFIFAKDGILLLSGDMYLESVSPMRIIMPTLLFIGLTNLLGIQVLVPLGREKAVLQSTIIGGVIDFILNLLLIPSLKSSGAAIGTLVAEIVVFLWQYSSVKKTLNIFNRSSFIKVVISTFIGGGISLLVLVSDIGIIWRVMLSAMLFFGSYGITLLLLKEPAILEILQLVMNKFSLKSRT